MHKMCGYAYQPSYFSVPANLYYVLINLKNPFIAGIKDSFRIYVYIKPDNGD